MTKFTLSPKQRKYIELLADPDEPRSDEEMAAELGVKLRTLETWRRRPELMEHLHALVREKTEQRMPRVWDALVEKAESGDTAAARLLFQLRGELVEKRQEELIGPPPVVNLIISKASDKE